VLAIVKHASLFLLIKNNRAKSFYNIVNRKTIVLSFKGVSTICWRQSKSPNDIISVTQFLSQDLMKQRLSLASLYIFSMLTLLSQPDLKPSKRFPEWEGSEDIR
jgi:hypothetical protein